ncbi:MAG: hypothetical protein HOI95_08700 [Chromatiales bacterium]|jgi:hypothetical protein|nr:hypothetical protein [Chromatiales bacterium]
MLTLPTIEILCAVNIWMLSGWTTRRTQRCISMVGISPLRITIIATTLSLRQARDRTIVSRILEHVGLEGRVQPRAPGERLGARRPRLELGKIKYLDAFEKGEVGNVTGHRRCSSVTGERWGRVGHNMLDKGGDGGKFV